MPKYDVFATEHPTAGRSVGLATAEESTSWKYIVSLTGSLAYAKERAAQLVTEGYYLNARVFTGGRDLGTLKFTVKEDEVASLERSLAQPFLSERTRRLLVRDLVAAKRRQALVRARKETP